MEDLIDSTPSLIKLKIDNLKNFRNTLVLWKEFHLPSSAKCFNLDRRGFLTPSWRDRNVPPIESESLVPREWRKRIFRITLALWKKYLIPLLPPLPAAPAHTRRVKRGKSLFLPLVSDPASGSEEPLARRERSLTRRAKGGGEGFYEAFFKALNCYNF